MKYKIVKPMASFINELSLPKWLAISPDTEMVSGLMLLIIRVLMHKRFAFCARIPLRPPRRRQSPAAWINP